MEDTEITAPDFIRALERTADPKANVGGYYSVIEGFDDFAPPATPTRSPASRAGHAHARDHHDHAVGDMSYWLAMGTASPIPPDAEGERMASPRTPATTVGSSWPPAVHVRGVRDDGLLGRPAKDQTEAPGTSGRPIVLVRNPSWSRDTDDLRDAFPDRIEVRIGGDNDDLYNQVAAGTLDFVVDGAVPGEDPRVPDQPDLQDKINVYASDAIRYVSFNLAVPPSTTSTSARR